MYFIGICSYIYVVYIEVDYSWFTNHSSKKKNQKTIEAFITARNTTKVADHH